VLATQKPPQPGDGGRKVLQNGGILLQHCMALQLKRL